MLNFSILLTLSRFRVCSTEEGQGLVGKLMVNFGISSVSISPVTSNFLSSATSVFSRMLFVMGGSLSPQIWEWRLHLMKSTLCLSWAEEISFSQASIHFWGCYSFITKTHETDRQTDEQPLVYIMPILIPFQSAAIGLKTIWIISKKATTSIKAKK